MLITLREVSALLCPPGFPEGRLELVWAGEQLQEAAAVEHGGAALSYPVIGGQPILVDFGSSVLSREAVEGAGEAESLVPRRSGRLRALKGELLGNWRISRRNFARFRQLLVENSSGRPLVLMVGAGMAGAGTEGLYDSAEVAQLAFDIYQSGLTNFVADAHSIPLRDNSVDGVCIQAVLEHVIDPAKVVSEIHRVLKPGGLVYAETPFMQQVHEGAYDFTRFTELGHRWLWGAFDQVERGSLGGPGLTMYWSTRYLLWGLLRNRRLASILSAPAGLFALLDRFIPESHRIDGANGVFFLGRKGDGRLTAQDLISDYLGAQAG